MQSTAIARSLTEKICFKSPKSNHVLTISGGRFNSNRFGTNWLLPYSRIPGEHLKIKGVVYSDAFNAYYQAMEKMKDIYYTYYQKPHDTFLLWQTLRIKVQNNRNIFWNKGGYKIYYGFRDLNPEIAMKVKSALNQSVIL